MPLLTRKQTYRMIR